MCVQLVPVRARQMDSGLGVKLPIVLPRQVCFQRRRVRGGVGSVVDARIHEQGRLPV